MSQHSAISSKLTPILSNKDVGLGDRFVASFRRSIEFILRFPAGCALIGDGRRRCQISPFRYGILYRVDEHAGEIKVSAIVHLESDPKIRRRD